MLKESQILEDYAAVKMALKQKLESESSILKNLFVSLFANYMLTK